MKENAQRILSWLYPQVNTSRWVKTAELPLIVPAVTSGGLQSILLYLQSRKRVVVERVGGSQAVSITTHGMKALEEVIPAFLPVRREWKGEWQLLLFLEAPAQDKNFRFLRRVLLAAAALPLARGMFLYPGDFPDKVTFELSNSYEGSVLLVKLKDWTFGDEKAIIGSIFPLGDLTDDYSSISKEIDTLLAIGTPMISFTDPQKVLFSSVFDRLFLALQTDMGIQRAYFPQVETGVSLLFTLQNISLQE